MLSFSFMFILASIFLGVLLYKKNNENNEKNVYIKNILIYIGLIMLSGIIYLFYEKMFNVSYGEQWPSIIGIILTLGILLYNNIVGIILSITKITRIRLIFIVYGLFMTSTILTYYYGNIIAKILENNNIISECSSILLVGIIMIIENLLSFIIVKIIIGINNKVRTYCT